MYHTHKKDIHVKHGSRPCSEHSCNLRTQAAPARYVFVNGGWRKQTTLEVDAKQRVVCSVDFSVSYDLIMCSARLGKATLVNLALIFHVLLVLLRCFSFSCSPLPSLPPLPGMWSVNKMSHNPCTPWSNGRETQAIPQSRQMQARPAGVASGPLTLPMANRTVGGSNCAKMDSVPVARVTRSQYTFPRLRNDRR